MSLKEIIDHMAELEAEAAINLDEVDPRVRVGAEGQQRAAKERLGQLRQDYLNEVVRHVFLIAIDGPGAGEFARIASEKFDTIALDYQLLPKYLRDRLVARRASELYGQNEHWMMLTELGQLKIKYDIQRLPPPQFNAMSSYYNQELYDAVRGMLQETYGNQLVSIVLRREIGNAALERRFKLAKLPVVIYNFDKNLTEGLDESLLPRPVSLLEAAEEVTEDSVKEALLKVRDSLGGRRRKKPSTTESQVTENSETEENQDE